MKIDLFRKLFVPKLLKDFILIPNFYFRNVQTKSPTLSHNLNPGPFGDNLNSSLKVNIYEFRYSENKPKMAYSRDLPKMARQQCGIMDENCSDT